MKKVTGTTKTMQDLVESAAVIMAKDGYVSGTVKRDRTLMEAVNAVPGEWNGHVGYVPKYDLEKDADSEVIFSFEDYDDAADLYEFMVENELMVPGEIVLRSARGHHTVHFSPMTVIAKPELIQAALMRYEEQVEEESIDAYESVMEDTIDVLTEAKSNAPDVDFNIYHDKEGRFSGASSIARRKGGSYSDSNRKGKFTGKGKGGLIKFGSTKHPCGRAARSAGENRRCWDGSKMESFEDREDVLLETKRKGWTLSGVPSKKNRPGYNMLHDKNGNFTSAEGIAKAGGGSYSDGTRKGKFSKVKRGKSTNAVHFGGTKHACGRAAREKGDNLRCWDSKRPAGVAKAMKRKSRNESYSPDEIYAIMEMRRKYGTA